MVRTRSGGGSDTIPIAGKYILYFVLNLNELFQETRKILSYEFSRGTIANTNTM